MIKAKFYPKVEPLLNSMAESLHAKKITPNQLSYAGLALSLLTGIIFSKGYLFVGALLMLLAGFGDALDGALARVSGKASKFGAFLDSTIDRYSDFFIYTGLALYFIRIREPFWVIVTLAVLLGSYVISYAKARGENFISDCSIGIFTRETRFVLTFLGALTFFLLKPILIILAIGCHITALRRILKVKNELEPPAPKEIEPEAIEDAPKPE